MSHTIGDKAPSEAQQASDARVLRSAFEGIQGVRRVKVLPTKGLFAGWAEPSFDIDIEIDAAHEGRTRDGLGLIVARDAKKYRQMDAFVLMHIDDTKDAPDWRPGIEIASASPLDEAAAALTERVKALAQRVDPDVAFDGFTLIARPDGMYDGVRLAFVPEMDLRALKEGWVEADDNRAYFEDLVSGNQERVEPHLRRRLDLVYALAHELNGNKGLSAEPHIYDIDSYPKETRNDEIRVLEARYRVSGEEPPRVARASTLAKTAQALRVGNEKGVLLRQSKEGDGGLRERFPTGVEGLYSKLRAEISKLPVRTQPMLNGPRPSGASRQPGRTAIMESCSNPASTRPPSRPSTRAGASTLLGSRGCSPSLRRPAVGAPS